MESDGGKVKETSSLFQSQKGPKTCYGATRTPENPADHRLLCHTLTLSDTLQGLAIKYGVTVEQIRRANKLWTSDNILVFKTLKIPVKLSYQGDGLKVNEWDNDYTANSGYKCKSGKNVLISQEGDGSEDSVDSGVHEVNHMDIKVDMDKSSSTESLGKVKKETSVDDVESLSKFLTKLDGDLKLSIQKAKKQRARSVPALLRSLEGSEGESSKSLKPADSNHKRLKTRRSPKARTRIRSQDLDDDNSSLDDLFQL